MQNLVRLFLVLLPLIVSGGACSNSPVSGKSDKPILMTGGTNAQVGIANLLSNASGRAASDMERDSARKPAEVLAFWDIKPGMRVMDVMAGGGYYTEVLSYAVGPEGEVIAQNFDWMLKMFGGGRATELMEKARRLSNVSILLAEFGSTRPPAELIERANMTELPAGFGPVVTRAETYYGQMDAAVTALNLHDILIFGGEDQVKVFLEYIYQSLKPGGIFGFIDHVGIEGLDNNNLHRVTRADALRLIKASGFLIEKEATLLHNPLDDHTLMMRDPSLKRNTDRMLIRARKPSG